MTHYLAELAGKRVFLTGATGLFGKWLLAGLRSIDVELVLLTRDRESFCQSFPLVRAMGVGFVEGDVRSFDFPSGIFDYVIHAATPVVSDDLNDMDAEMISVIAEGTNRVLQFAEESGVRRLLYVSSGAVYGPIPLDVDTVEESQCCHPNTAYGQGKLVAEDLCLKSSVDCVIARCFAFVGPHLALDAHFAVGNFIGNCLRGEPIRIRGDGRPLRSYMADTDLADWLLALLVGGQCGEVYNVGSDEAISIAELAHLVRKVAGGDNSIEIEGVPNHGQRPPRYVPSVEKARDALGLNCSVGLEDAIFRTIEFYRETNAYSRNFDG